MCVYVVFFFWSYIRPITHGLSWHTWLSCVMFETMESRDVWLSHVMDQSCVPWHPMGDWADVAQKKIYCLHTHPHTWVAGVMSVMWRMAESCDGLLDCVGNKWDVLHVNGSRDVYEISVVLHHTHDTHCATSDTWHTYILDTSHAYILWHTSHTCILCLHHTHHPHTYSETHHTCTYSNTHHIHTVSASHTSHTYILWDTSHMYIFVSIRRITHIHTVRHITHTHN